MTFEEFENLGSEYCKPKKINAFSQDMISSGEIIYLKQGFYGNYIIYDILFDRKTSYEKYLSTINKKWFDPKKFEDMGFSVKLDKAIG